MRGVFEKVKGSNDWYIRYPNPDAPGKKIREHIGRFDVAVEALVKRRQEIREARWIAPHHEPRITFTALAEKMMADKDGRARPRTVYGNRRTLLRICSIIGDMPAGNISTAKINEVLRALRVARPRSKKPSRAANAKQISGPVMNNYRWLLNSVFAYGIDNGLVAKNPVAGTRAFAKHPGIIRYLTSDEEGALRVAMREWNPDMEAEMDLALNTGLRSGEQFLLTWDLIDLDRGILTVPAEGKTGRRFIPLNSTARAAIQRLHEQSKGSPHVCCQMKSGHYRRTAGFEKIVKEAGVMNFRWHDLRHTFASRLVMAGVDLRTVQQFLGHTSIVMTMRYAHLSPEHGQAAIERLVTPATAPSKIARIA